MHRNRFIDMDTEEIKDCPMILKGKAKTMTEFVLWLLDDLTVPSRELRGQRTLDTVYREHVTAYAHLITRPLELGMFVPCVDGNPIENIEPTAGMAKYKIDEHPFYDSKTVKKDREQYQKACKEVLFNEVDFDIESYLISISVDTNIEDLINSETDLEFNDIELGK